MDRDEYPMAANAGVVSSAVKLSEGPDVELVPPDTVKLEPLQDDATPAAEDAPQAADAAGDVQPADGTAPAEDAIEPAQIIEALLFASDTPLNAARLSDLSGVGSVKQVRLHIEALNAKYDSAGLSFRVESIAKGYQLLTQPAYQPWLAKLDKHRGQTRLTPAALETLSVVAYKQPVIRADVEAIRGVACGEVLNRLREMGLVRIIGRAEIVGRPMLYGTTRKFLDTFGLADLDDLPPMESLSLRRPGKSTKPEPEATPEPEAELVPEPEAIPEPEEVPVAVAGA